MGKTSIRQKNHKKDFHPPTRHENALIDWLIDWRVSIEIKVKLSQCGFEKKDYLLADF